MFLMKKFCQVNKNIQKHTLLDIISPLTKLLNHNELKFYIIGLPSLNTKEKRLNF